MKQKESKRIYMQTKSHWYFDFPNDKIKLAAHSPISWIYYEVLKV